MAIKLEKLLPGTIIKENFKDQTYIVISINDQEQVIELDIKGGYGNKGLGKRIITGNQLNKFEIIED